MPTKIEWTQETWNPVTGCTPVSEGCRNCYAERMARRLAGRYGYPETPRHFDVTLHPDRLDQPLHWKKPRTIFVCSMSDLFHEDVPFDFIGKVLGLAANLPHHTFQILTKRPQRMLEFYRACEQANGKSIVPPSNVWLGVSVENQFAANERIPILLQIPAAVRFVSCEPLLGPIDLTNMRLGAAEWGNALQPIRDICPAIDWIIVGGESGPGARPMPTAAASLIVQQCRDANVPVFMKQLGTVWAKRLGLSSAKGSDLSEWPWTDLKVREFPNDIR